MPRSVKNIIVNILYFLTNLLAKLDRGYISQIDRYVIRVIFFSFEIIFIFWFESAGPISELSSLANPLIGH